MEPIWFYIGSVPVEIYGFALILKVVLQSDENIIFFEQTFIEKCTMRCYFSVKCTIFKVLVVTGYHPRIMSFCPSVCPFVCLSVQTITFEPLHIGTSFLVKSKSNLSQV